MTATMLELTEAAREKDLAVARELFREYAASVEAPVCFQSFEKELAGLPGEYAPPQGAMLLAFSNSQSAGCVALRKLRDGVAEIKRLYVRREFRGESIGRRLTEEILKRARAAGYHRVSLETLPSMKEAIALYESIGFRRTAPPGAPGAVEVIRMELGL